MRKNQQKPLKKATEEKKKVLPRGESEKLGQMVQTGQIK